MELLSATQLSRNGDHHLVHRLHPFEIDDDDDDPVKFVAVTKNNSIVELDAGGRQLTECRFKFPVLSKRCSNLSVFQSYNPTYRHYLFMNGDSLVVVVKRDNRLSVRDTVRGVAKYSIVDRYSLGKPQVVVQMVKGEVEVFDFSERLFASRESEKRLEGGVKPKVLSQIQMLRTMAKSAEEVLLEKTRLINKYTKSVLMNASNVDDDYDETLRRDIPVTGGPIETPLQRLDSVLEVGPSWVKILDNQWVIGFHVTNSQEIHLTQFQLFAFSKHVTIKESVLFCRQSENHSKVDFCSPVAALNGFQSGFIVGVLNEPHFIQPTVKFGCMAICRSTAEHQTYLGEIRVSVDDLKKLSLFEPDLSFSDIIAIQATYKQLNFTLEGDDPSETGHFLFESLIDNHSFLPISDSVIINISRESYYYSLIVIKTLTHPTNNYIFVYNEPNQLLGLFHKLRNACGSWKFVPKSEISSWVSAKNALKEELTYIQNALINELTEDPSVESEMKYSLDCLLNLQMRTAKEISSLR